MIFKKMLVLSDFFFSSAVCRKNFILFCNGIKRRILSIVCFTNIVSNLLSSDQNPKDNQLTMI